MEMNDMQQPIRIGKDDMEEVTCECGCKFFKEVYVIRKVSGLLVGKSEDQYVPMNVLVCDKCGKEFNPEEKKQESKLLI